MTLLDLQTNDAALRPPRGLRPSAAPRGARPTIEAFKRLLRSSLVGVAATVVTIAILTGCSRLLGMDVVLANAVAVAVGTTIQFVGSRHYSFRAAHGDVTRQVRWFIPVEIGAYLLANAVFILLVRLLDLNREVANMVAGFVVYFGFSYPIWHWVFKVDRAVPGSGVTAAGSSRP